MSNMHNNHSEKTQAKAILLVFNKYLLKTKLRYFITNNVFLNNSYIIKIINLIYFNLDTKKRKLKCIRYIINLIIKTFIFNNKSKFFKINIFIAESINNLKITIKL